MDFLLNILNFYLATKVTTYQTTDPQVDLFISSELFLIYLKILIKLSVILDFTFGLNVMYAIKSNIFQSAFSVKAVL